MTATQATSTPWATTAPRVATRATLAAPEGSLPPLITGRSLHYRALKRTCPDCGKPAHVVIVVGMQKILWLHDDHKLGPNDTPPDKLAGHASLKLTVPELDALCLAAEKRGVEVRGAYDAEPKCNPNQHKGCAVLCVETGEVFESMTQAADRYGCGRTAIAGAIRREGTSRGYHWCYA